LITIDEIKKIDQSEMYKVYDNWPELAKKNYEEFLVDDSVIPSKHIVFAGMGGSGTISDIFSSIFSKTNIHVEVVKGYHLPKTVNEKTLVIAISISGNTVETLEILKQSVAENCKIVAVSSGGKMEELCNNKKIRYHKIPMVHSPRASLVSFLYALLRILEKIIPLSKNNILESITELSENKTSISTSNLDKNNFSLSIANFINDLPVVYYPYGLQSAAIRFKNSLQENAKIQCITEDVIEASHNGIVPWTNSTSFRPLFIQGEDDYIKTKERWKIFKKFFQENKIEFLSVVSNKGNILSKIINLIYLLDFSTIYLSVQLGKDPSPVTSIDYIKKNLSKEN